MLRINLLPIRQLKKTARAKKQLLGIALLFLGIVGICAIIGILQANFISDLETDIKTLTNKKASYAPQLNKLAEYKKDKEELLRKIEVIKTLKSESSLTVRILDAVAAKIDKQRMWLESLNQQNANLQLTGVALDNQSIAQFMDKLKESPFVKDVSLGNSSQKLISGRSLKGFDLSCIVALPNAKETNPAVGKK